MQRDSTAYLHPTSSSYGHNRIVRYHYDLSGRRDLLYLPNGGTIGYAYRPDDGALATVTDPTATPYRFVYDLVGRVDSLVIGANMVREKRW